MKFLKNIPKREKFLLLIALIVIFFLLCYNFLIEPLLKKVELINQEVGTNELKLKKIKRLLQQKDEIAGLYEQYAKDIKIKGFSDEEEVANFLSYVESLVRQSSVYINDVKPKPVKNLGSYKRFVFDLEIEGTVENLTKFIYELEKSSEAIRIERLQISVKTGKEDVLRTDLTIAKLAMP